MKLIENSLVKVPSAPMFAHKITLTGEEFLTLWKATGAYNSFRRSDDAYLLGIKTFPDVKKPIYPSMVEIGKELGVVYPEQELPTYPPTGTVRIEFEPDEILAIYVTVKGQQMSKRLDGMGYTLDTLIQKFERFVF